MRLHCGYCMRGITCCAHRCKRLWQIISNQSHQTEHLGSFLVFVFLFSWHSVSRNHCKKKWAHFSNMYWKIKCKLIEERTFSILKNLNTKKNNSMLICLCSRAHNSYIFLSFIKSIRFQWICVNFILTLYRIDLEHKILDENILIRIPFQHQNIHIFVGHILCKFQRETKKIKIETGDKKVA